ncbi:MAG TPA: chemotaxis protein CheW [Kofleriaceae bacterium]|nr:chemotaxis protein CheW [Kofleriaceae bacterium]
MNVVATAPTTGSPGKDDGLCAFWLGGRCFGLNVRWVGEVVALEAITRVPNARPAIRGLFNLRGEPVVVLDLSRLLELGDRDAAVAPGGQPGQPSGKVGLVLRIGELAGVIEVERVESIIPPGRGELAPRGDGEHRAVVGLLDDRASGGRIVTVLDSALLLERLQALRYLADADD